jgi:hypothetical protein
VHRRREQCSVVMHGVFALSVCRAHSTMKLGDVNASVAATVVLQNELAHAEVDECISSTQADMN